MPARITFSVKQSGPFFELKGKPLKDAGAATIQDLLKEAEAKLKVQFYPGHGEKSGAYLRTISHKFVRSSQNANGWGKVFADKSYPNGIIGRWLEGKTKRNMAQRFKGFAMYRKTKQHIAKLTRQMAGRQYKKAVQRLT